jgi:molecular chaperone DnaK
MTPMIPSNTTIPTKKTEIFSTAADNQPSVEIHVLQGERPMATDNKSLGKFHLDGIPPAPRGVPQVEVTFDIDVNGILNVSAKDKASNKEQSIRITSSGGLSQGEIDRMKREAQDNAAADRKRKEDVEIRNQADQTVFSTRRQLSELGDKIPADGKAKIEAAIEKLENALKSDVPDEIRSAKDEVDRIWSEVSQQMYAQASQQGPAGGDGAGAGAGSQQPNVEDADYTIVDDEK